MIEEKRENRGEQPEEQVNIQEILFRYLIHWPWFVVSVIICIVCAWGYLRLATPVYNISATVLIKDDKKGGGASMSSELEKMGLDARMVGNPTGIYGKTVGPKGQRFEKKV